jgi:hypothetical protein
LIPLGLDDVSLDTYVVTLVSRLRHTHKQHHYNKQAVQHCKPISKSCDTGKLTGKQLGVVT